MEDRPGQGSGGEPVKQLVSQLQDSKSRLRLPGDDRRAAARVPPPPITSLPALYSVAAKILLGIEASSSVVRALNVMVKLVSRQMRFGFINLPEQREK